MSRRLPPFWTLTTQDFAVLDFIQRNRPLPSEYLPGAFKAAMPVAVKSPMSAPPPFPHLFPHLRRVVWKRQETLRRNKPLQQKAFMACLKRQDMVKNEGLAVRVSA
jgi:hypothetical protein